ncbi:EAL domain-containing protein [Thalassotalea sp. Y01]|uniref:bifunctional diguanylate cyclase/phosphodiesterase n=1 Tax=Thalassotalea sp. Y01 TaxID=2729613 RepID=UPI00145F14EE|nr:EAL domain-containing protein [Thalassotalea sp. Y01]NMP15454.1 EAL domain-containing protein [Thalassotalea sp. Y01]
MPAKFSLQFDSLKKTIVFFFVLLLIIVQGVSFFTTKLANERLEEQQLNLQLLRAETLLQNELDNRNYYITAFAETVAKDYGLKQVLMEDTRSILFALNNHRQRIDADIAIAIDKEATIIGQLLTIREDGQRKVVKGAQIGQVFAQRSWLTEQSKAQFWQYKDTVYQLVIAPIRNGDMVIGYISFGYNIDEKLVGELAQLSDFHVGFGLIETDNWQWLANSETNRSINQQSDFLPLAQTIDQNFVFSNYRLGRVDGQSLMATTYQLRSSLTESVKKDSIQLLMMIGLMAVLSVVAAYYIAIVVTRPLSKLLIFSKAIAQGEYDSKVDVGQSKELNQLANQLDSMQNAIYQREQEISRQAYFDNLTKLPNRNQFYRDMQDKHGPLVVCQISICRLSQINDTLGHKVGDEVICEVANRLQHMQLSLYKTSGNGFIVVYFNRCHEDISRCIQQLTEHVESSFVVQNIALHLQVHAGVTICKGKVNAIELLKEVDSAMQLAKRLNSPFQVYDEQIDLNTLDRLQLLSRIKPALENDEFILHFQPKLNLHSKRVEEVEALVRWQHPVHGLLGPDRFIQITEQTGQMKTLSLWVIEHAIEQYYRWKEQDLDIKIAINISPGNLLDDDFCDQLISLLTDNNKLCDVLVFEITEDAFIDHNSKAVENINRLKEHSVRLSIDDYGTGYSSLAQLKNLTVEELKIDRCFVQKLFTDTTDQMIVRSTLQLAHQLGLVVVAEGVEDQQTLDWLTENQCEKAQGYFISRPLPAEQFSQWLIQSVYLDHSKQEKQTSKQTDNDNKNNNSSMSECADTDARVSIGT